MNDEIPVSDPIEIRGAVWTERSEHGIIPRRYRPATVARFADDFMRAAAGQSAGIRLAFRTAATRVELRVTATALVDAVENEPMAGVYELCARGEVHSSATSTAGTRRILVGGQLQAEVPGSEDTLIFSLDGEVRDYELWLPYTDEVELRGFRADAPISAPAAASRPRWVHHGSSISHGYRASRSTRSWPVVVANAAELDLVNLSYTGNALLDQSTARTIRDTPADVITLKLGINIVNSDSMRLRVFRSAVHGFLDTIRDGHPGTPILVISPIFCEPVESVPGPRLRELRDGRSWSGTRGRSEEVSDGKLSLEVVRRELSQIVSTRAEWDPHLAYADGLELYGRADNARLPLPDNLHPADDVNSLIAERFISAAYGRNGWMPRASLTCVAR